MNLRDKGRRAHRDRRNADVFGGDSGARLFGRAQAAPAVSGDDRVDP